MLICKHGTSQLLSLLLIEPMLEEKEILKNNLFSGRGNFSYKDTGITLLTTPALGLSLLQRVSAGHSTEDRPWAVQHCGVRGWDLQKPHTEGSVLPGAPPAGPQGRGAPEKRHKLRRATPRKARILLHPSTRVEKRENAELCFQWRPCRAWARAARGSGASGGRGRGPKGYREPGGRLTRDPTPARSPGARACPRTASSSCSWRRRVSRGGDGGGKSGGSGRRSGRGYPAGSAALPLPVTTRERSAPSCCGGPEERRLSRMRMRTAAGTCMRVYTLMRTRVQAHAQPCTSNCTLPALVRLCTHICVHTHRQAFVHTHRFANTLP